MLVMIMTRRLFLMVSSPFALPTSFTGPRGIGASWASRAFRRWELAAHFERSAEFRKRSVRRWTELYQRLGEIDIEPDRREELDRDMAEIRAMADRDTELIEHYTRLAALFRRAARRPRQEIPRRPESKRSAMADPSESGVC
jgi:hypothetical protein